MQIRKTLVAALSTTLLTFGASADNTVGNWVFDSDTKTISDGTWTFVASLSKGTITISNVTEDGAPAVISELDFSKTVEKKDDPSTTYTIVKLNVGFSYYSSSTKNYETREGLDKVGALTLPGAGLTEIGAAAFWGCTNMTGDIVIPASVTTVGLAAFKNTKITSVRFEPSSVNIGGSSNNSRGCFAGCTELTNAVFAAGGTATLNGYAFGDCTSLVKADLSGVSNLAVYSEKESNWHFKNCSALREIIFSSGLAAYSSNVFVSTMTSLATVRFTGAPPSCLHQPVFEGSLSKVQTVTTIVPPEQKAAWAAYTEGGELLPVGSTWAAAYVESGVDAAYRPLVYEVADPTKLAPIVGNVAVSARDTSVTITPAGDYLNGGTVWAAVEGNGVATTNTLSEFGASTTIGGLTGATAYTWKVGAYNANGTAEVVSDTFTTYPTTNLAARVVYDPSDCSYTFYYDTIDRSGDGGTIYEVGPNGARTWGFASDSDWHDDGDVIDSTITVYDATNFYPVVTKVTFDSSFKDYRPKTMNQWFSRLKGKTDPVYKNSAWSYTQVGVTFEGLENLNASEVTDMTRVFYNTAFASGTVPDITKFRTDKVTTFEQMFGYGGWDVMDLSSFNTKKATNMYQMFIGSKVTTIYASEMFTTNLVTKDTDMFKNCKNLTGANGTQAYSGGSTSNPPAIRSIAITRASIPPTPPDTSPTRRIRSGNAASRSSSAD